MSRKFICNSFGSPSPRLKTYLHTSSSLTRKDAELMWKSFEIFSRSVLDFRIKNLMNLFLMKKLSHSSRNLATKEILDLLLRCIQTTCTNHENLSAIINKCLSGKTTYLDKIRLSRAQILWGIFTKAIIQHFISKDKSISMRNKMFMHTVKDDSVLGTLKFVAKSEDNQVYGALIPAQMINQKIQNSTAYKTYLAFATGAATPKKARKWKQPGSAPKKKAFTAKYPDVAKKPTGVLVKDTPGVSVSKKKTPTRAERNKGGSGDGAGFQLEVPDEPKGKSIDTHKGTGLKPWVLDVSKAGSSDSEYESWRVSDDDDDQQDDDERTNF
ncbi:hypothetical protein Tco_1070319 [Tanacetum coccineum]|uniref:Uncharacterized protein n=1 Tax=Tanacetum coccineum TaxID=301880 RepID=A0ABQ5HMX6_9ASTR